MLRDVAFQSGVDFALMGAAPDGALDLMRPAPLPSLTARELECLQWTMVGKTSWEIGRILNISVSTVNFHVAGFNRKLEVSHRNQAVVKAMKLGLLQ